jgi:pantoate--beta-alanine ligase
MIIFKRSVELNRYLKGLKAEGNRIGFIPTMGALHNGHISLIEQAETQSDTTVCSIFVNPTQFNNPGDFSKYPVTIEKDLLLLEGSGTDILFLPDVEEIYPAGMKALPGFDLGWLETVLEGSFRPGHFQGVCQVMDRMLDIVQPHHLFMGQKDYQQCMVVKRLLELKSSDTELVTCPTVREADGLAMSSRNLRLSVEERKKAVAIFNTLNYIRKNFGEEAITTLKNNAKQLLETSGLKVDYVEIADADNLRIFDTSVAHRNAIALIAAFMNEVRLIDNMKL